MFRLAGSTADSSVFLVTAIPFPILKAMLSISILTALVILLFIQSFRFPKSALTLYRHTYSTPQFRRWLIAVYVFL